MIRALVFIATVSIFTACSAVSPYSPDGSRIQHGCANGNVVLPVKVVDVNNKPVFGATVTATNRASHKIQTGTTDGSGVTTAVTEAIGAGDVDITASEGARTSTVVSALVTCGQCDCLIDPAAATLTVQ